MNSEAELQSLSYREIQSEAKQLGIPANKKREVLIQEIIDRKGNEKENSIQSKDMLSPVPSAVQKKDPPHSITQKKDRVSILEATPLTPHSMATRQSARKAARPAKSSNQRTPASTRKPIHTLSGSLSAEERSDHHNMLQQNSSDITAEVEDAALCMSPKDIESGDAADGAEGDNFCSPEHPSRRGSTESLAHDSSLFGTSLEAAEVAILRAGTAISTGVAEMSSSPAVATASDAVINAASKLYSGICDASARASQTVSQSVAASAPAAEKTSGAEADSLSGPPTPTDNVERDFHRNQQQQQDAYSESSPKTSREIQRGFHTFFSSPDLELGDKVTWRYEDYDKTNNDDGNVLPTESSPPHGQVAKQSCLTAALLVSQDIGAATTNVATSATTKSTESQAKPEPNSTAPSAFGSTAAEHNANLMRFWLSKSGVSH